MELQEGLVIELENGESYLISNHFMHDGTEYVAIVSINEPVHVKFAEVIESEDESQISIEPLEDEERINFFKQYVVNEFFADVEDEQEDAEEGSEVEYAEEDAEVENYDDGGLNNGEVDNDVINED